MIHLCRCLQKRFAASGLKRLNNLSDRVYGDLKRSLFKGLPSRIVEIGAGCGANFRYYPPATQVIAVEPNLYMHAELKLQADRFGLELEIIDQPGEAIPLPDQSYSVVVMTLVLCSVQSPQGVLDEIYRILKCDGELRLLEHVLGRTSLIRTYQKMLLYPWATIFDGCRLTSDPASFLEHTRFKNIDLNFRLLAPSVIPIAPHVYGKVTKQ